MTFDLAVEAMARNVPGTWRVEPFRRHAELVDETNSKRSLPLLSLASTGIIAPRAEAGGMGKQAPSESTIERYWVAHPGNLVVNPMWLIGGGIGVSAVTGAVSPDYRVYRLGPDLHPRYVHYLLRSTPYRDQYRLYTRADTTFDRRVSKENFHPMPLLVPPLEEQRRIADFLDTETARLGRIEGLVRKAGQLAVARRTAVIDAELGALNEDCVAPVTSVCELVLDCVNKTAPIESGETPYRMLRTSNVRDGQVNVDDTYRVSEETFKKWNRRGAPQIGDVLFTRQAPVGEAGLLSSDAPVFLGQQVMLYRPNKLHTIPEFLLYNFLSSFMKRQFELASDGAAHSHMRVHDCLKLRIYYPPLDKQRQIVGRVSSALNHADGLRAATAKQADLLAERRQALITAAVTGQFDVSTASGRNVTDGVTA